MVFTVIAAFAAVVILLPSVSRADETDYPNTLYLQDGGTGSGESADDPAGDLVGLLTGVTGNTHIILTGDYTTAAGSDGANNTRLDTATYGVRFTDALKITATNGARLIMNSHIVLGGPLEIDDLTLQCNGGYQFKCQCNPFAAGENITSVPGEGASVYPTIVGTTNPTLTNKTTSITVKSGDWDKIRGGSSNTSAKSTGGTVISVSVSGGTFHGYVALGSRGNMTSVSVNADISGGEFLKGLYLIVNENETLTNGYTADYNAELTIRGGIFHGVIAPSHNSTNTLTGSWHVTVTDGDFTCLTDILGAEIFNGTMASEIRIREGLPEQKPAALTQTFTNPIMSGADPFLFMKDGFYYLVKTASKNLVLYKAASLAELQTVTGQYVFTLTDGNNLWSPEIHYFSASEVGAEDAGWYCFIGYTADSTEGETSSSRQRQYVLKCLDENDNLFGQWGDPVTGAAQPRQIVNPDDPDFNVNEFCAGSSKLVLNGTAYMTYVTELNRSVQEKNDDIRDDFHQEIMITALENPWTYRGTPVSICVPDQEWEQYGHQIAQNANGEWMMFPAVVEGASPVYYTDSNGQEECYLMYTGSGYWTQWYALGYLKCLDTSDPLNAANWQKMTYDPILQKDYSKNDINSCGHGSYLKVGDSYWVSYHARLTHTAQHNVFTGENDTRYAFFEPIYVDERGVSIGDRDGHPANLSRSYQVKTAAVALSKKINGFDSVEEITNSVVYLDGAGGDDTNSGFAPESPLCTLDAALDLMRQYGGGILVVCGPTAVNGDSYVLPDIGGRLTVTSEYGGEDYRETNGACFCINGALVMSNDLRLDKIDLVADGPTVIYGCYNDFTVEDCVLYANAGTADAPVRGTAVDGGSDPLLTFVCGARSQSVRNVEGFDILDDDLDGDDTDGNYWYGHAAVDQTVDLGSLSWRRIAVGSKAVGEGIYTSAELCSTDTGSVTIVIGDGASVESIDTVSANLDAGIELPALLQNKTAYRSENALDPQAETTVFIAEELLPEKDNIVIFRDPLKLDCAYMQIGESLTMSFSVKKELFTEAGYSSPLIRFTFNGRDETVAAYTEKDLGYIFDFRGVCPQQMGDIIGIELHAIYQGEEIVYTTSYSAGKYLYALLGQYAPENDTTVYAEKLRTLAADLLLYGTASQNYMGYRTESPVSARMTETQLGWATQAAPEYTDVRNAKYAAISAPSVSWKSITLRLDNNLNYKIRLSSDEDVSTLRLAVDRGSVRKTEIRGSDFVDEGGYYTAVIPGISLSEIRDTFLFTVYSGDEAVSNTLSYSVTSYAYSKRNTEDGKLADIVEKIVKCGDSALAFKAAQ